MKRRIVILEPWKFPQSALKDLQTAGEVICITEESSLPEALKSAEVLVVRLKYNLDRAFFEQAPRLKAICTATTGLDHIDLAAAGERGIEVLSLRGETEFLQTVTATAEHCWGLLLALLRQIPAAHQSVINGEWDRTRFFGRELQQRQLGIVGLGRIGKMVAQYGLAFRMNVAAYDPIKTDWLSGVERIGDLNELVTKSDVLSVHVPLNEETKSLIGKEQFHLMKSSCVIVNTSRGAILDQNALLEALEQGRIGGAALDVVEDEYDSTSDVHRRLIDYAAKHHNLLITPHLGGATFDSLEKVENFMTAKLLARIGRSAG